MNSRQHFVAFIVNNISGDIYMYRVRVGVVRYSHANLYSSNNHLKRTTRKCICFADKRMRAIVKIIKVPWACRAHSTFPLFLIFFLLNLYLQIAWFTLSQTRYLQDLPLVTSAIGPLISCQSTSHNPLRIHYRGSIL